MKTELLKYTHLEEQDMQVASRCFHRPSKLVAHELYLTNTYQAIPNHSQHPHDKNNEGAVNDYLIYLFIYSLILQITMFSH